MNRQSEKILTVILAVATLAAAASAGTITFSGRTWTTFDATGREGSANTYTTPDANTGVIGARYAVDNYMFTTISLVAGDTVSYDYYLSDNDPGYTSPGDAQGQTYYGDWTTLFAATTSDFSLGNWVTARTYSDRDGDSVNNNHITMELNNQAGNNLFSITSGLSTGVHFVWTFGATSYSVTGTSIANPSDTMTYSGNYLNGLTVSDIQSFRAGLYDSEQTATLANFAITPVPEPASMSLIGLGCAALVLMRRRQG